MDKLQSLLVYSDDEKDGYWYIIQKLIKYPI